MKKQCDLTGMSLFWYRLVRVVMDGLVRLYFRTHFKGVENVPDEGAYLLLCNHQSWIDPILCAGRIRNRQLCFFARDTLFKNRIIGSMLRSVNAIPVKRGEADIAAMKRVIDRLKNGKIVCMYPEGTRTRDGRIAQIKPGSTFLCRRGRAGVIPMVIEGMYDAWPRDKKYPKPGKVHVKFAEPMSYEQVKSLSEDEFNDTITTLMRKVQNELRAEMGLEPIKY